MNDSVIVSIKSIPLCLYIVRIQIEHVLLYDTTMQLCHDTPIKCLYPAKIYTRHWFISYSLVVERNGDWILTHSVCLFALKIFWLGAKHIDDSMLGCIIVMGNGLAAAVCIDLTRQG